MTARIHTQPRHRQDTTSNGSRSNSSVRKNGVIDNKAAASSSSALSAAAVVAAVARLHQAHLQQQALFDPESSNSPNTSPCVSPSLSQKFTDGRRTNKPLMEKRRRARINQSLAALKALILDSARLENTKHSKLEKADILELTVRHLQRQRSLAQPGLSRYKAGYQDCSREVARYLDAPDIITGNTSPIDPAYKQRLVRHLDSCVSELDLDLGSRPDSGLGSSPGSVTDRALNPGSPTPLDHQHHSAVAAAAAAASAAALHCSAALGAAAAAGLVKDVTDLDIAVRPDSSTTAPGDENNNSSRPTSAFAQMHVAAAMASGMTGIDAINGAAPNPSMMSVVQVIPSRLPDGQVVFLLPSHYVQLAAAAAANGISIGPNPPTAIWAATNMSLLKETDKLLKRPLCSDPQDWTDLPIKPSKSPRIDSGLVEQPLDFTTSSAKKLKAAAARYLAEQQHKQQQQQQQQMHHDTLAAVAAAQAVLGCSSERPLSCSSSSQNGEMVGINYVKREEIKQEMTSAVESEAAMTTTMAQSQHNEESPSPPIELQQIKDEEGMWRPW